MPNRCLKRRKVMAPRTGHARKAAPGECAGNNMYTVSTRKTMIVALARKLLIALWRLVTRGEVPQGIVLRPAS